MVGIIKINTEEELMLIYNFLQHGLLPDFTNGFQKRDFIRKCSNFVYNSNVLYVKHKNMLKRYFCEFETEQKNIIIKEKHLPGHIGANKLKNVIDEEFCGIKSKDISVFIESCRTCNLKSKPELTTNISPIIIEDVHQRIMADLMDFSMYSDFNSGYKYAFALIDCFSKFAFVFPIKEKTGIAISEILENIFYTEGQWTELVTDNGREFCNKDF
ncbi:SCAN domain-containing protein 3 [Dictyocoela muelleri]|nr:SCAN domain-containing protein 3 [Dictyocoela muelleri]